MNSPSDSVLRSLTDWSPAVDSITEDVRLVDQSIEPKMIHEERQAEVELAGTGDLLRGHETKMLHAVTVVQVLALTEDLSYKSKQNIVYGI